jgi:hypothetical protein
MQHNERTAKGVWHFYFNKVVIMIILKSIKIAYFNLLFDCKNASRDCKNRYNYTDNLENKYIDAFFNRMNLNAHIRKYYE